MRSPWHSKITEVNKDSLTTYGVDQREIIKNFSYEEMVYFIITGRRPTEKEKTLLRAVIVSHISHGITGQSTLAVMMAADVRSDFLHGAVAGFSVGAGQFHQGGLRATMEQLVALSSLSEDALERHIDDVLGSGGKVMGYGHRYHANDPRAVVLVEIAESLGHDGPHFTTAKRLERLLRSRKGIAMNIEAAGGSLLLDIGFSPQIAHLIIIIGRAPMYAAVYLERLQQGLPPFPKIQIDDIQ